MDKKENIPLSKHIQEILTLVSSITSIDTSVFIRRDDLGLEWYFSELEADFNALKEYLKSFSDSTLSHIPDIQLEVIKQNLDRLCAVIRDIQSFSTKPPEQPQQPQRPGVPAQPPPVVPINWVSAQKLQKINIFRQTLNLFYNSTQTLITVGLTPKFEELGEMKKKLEKLEEFYLKQTGTATNQQVKKEGNRFDTQSGKNTYYANWWFFASIIMITSLIIYISDGLSDKESIVSLFNQRLPDSVFKAELIRQIVIRLLIISILTFALIFCIKNYNAQRHNSIVKKHKSNCLNTYYDFDPIIADFELKKDVLSSATKAIFENHETGYSSKDSEMPSPNIISTIVEKAIPKGNG